MNEGEVFNTEALKMSIKRINQLGYFKQMEGAPDIKPSEHGGEQGRRHVQGRGAEPQPVHVRRRRERARGHLRQRVVLDHELPRRRRDVPGLRADRQAHARTTRSSVSEPYFLDRPITAGDRPVQAQDHLPAVLQRARATRRTAPASAWSRGFLVGKWSRAFLNYTYEVIKIGEAKIDPNDPYYQLLHRRTATAATIVRRRRRLRPAAVRRVRPSARRAGSRRTSSTTRSTTRTRRARACATRSTMQFTGGPARRDGELPAAERGVDLLPAGRRARCRSAPASRPPTSTRTATPRCCRTTSATSSAARRRSAATRSARSARSTRRAGRSAATSSRSSTPSTTSTSSGRCARCSSSTPARRSSRARSSS